MTSLQNLPVFLAYFGGSLTLLMVFLLLQSLFLRIPEWQLIRAGNAAAAVSVAGAVGGFTLPLASAIIHSAGFADMVVWAAVSGVVQFACYAAIRLLRRDVGAALERGDMAEAIVMASGSLITGLLIAACLS